MPDLLFCAKYPFTREAREYVQESGAKINEEILARAKKRVLSALLEGEIPKFSEILPENFPKEIFSYAASRMIVSQTKGRYFINRYAVAEAKRAGKYLSTEEDGNFSKALLEFGIPFSQEGKDKFKIPVLKYLKYSPKSIDYKLVNREVKGGAVFCTKQQLARIAEEAVKKSIETSLPIKAKVPPQVLGTANEIIKELPVQETQVSKIASEDFPPCIRDLLERLAVSENLPHTARWALAVYLVNAGMSVEAAANIFKTAPDYSRETTLYQITHVKERGYKMPSCATMDTYGICNARCGCFSPMRYRKGTELRNKKEQSAKSDENE